MQPRVSCAKGIKDTATARGCAKKDPVVKVLWYFILAPIYILQALTRIRI